MHKIAVTLTLTLMLLGSCGAPKQIEPVQSTAVPETAETTAAPEIEEYSVLPDPPAPDMEAPEDTEAPPADPVTDAAPEEGLTNPPAPGMEDAAPEENVAETGTVPAMPDGLDVPPMPDVNS